MEMILLHSSRPISRNGVLPPIPALLTRMSMRPNASRTDATMADTDAGSATLTATATARPPCCLRPATYFGAWRREGQELPCFLALSRGADGVRASKAQHVVERLDCD